MPSPTRLEAEPADGSFRARDAVVALACLVLGLGFGCLVWLRRGAEPAQQYLAGYLIELSPVSYTHLDVYKRQLLAHVWEPPSVVVL